MGPADWKKVIKQRREKKRAALKKKQATDSTSTVRNGSRRAVTRRSPRKGCGCKRKR